MTSVTWCATFMQNAIIRFILYSAPVHFFHDNVTIIFAFIIVSVQSKLTKRPHQHCIWTVQSYLPGRACLDQLLIAIRSFTLLCDQSRSQARLITIMKLIAKLGIIYTTACHDSLCTTALDCLSVSCHCRLLYIQTRHGEGEVGISETVAAAAGALGHCLKWLQAASNC